MRGNRESWQRDTIMCIKECLSAVLTITCFSLIQPKVYCQHLASILAPTLGFESCNWLTAYTVNFKHIQLFRERLSEKSTKVHATRPKGGLGILWNFAYWPRGNVQVCIFARGEFVFPFRKPISVALLLLLHVFELGKFF